MYSKKLDNYFEVEFTHVVLIRSVTSFGISVFVSLFTYNKREDLNEFKHSNWNPLEQKCVGNNLLKINHLIIYVFDYNIIRFQ